ncbi:NAD(P)/FAD-dependent oxidoreductase [Shewanella aestuarii]|uniref:FAD-binding oxidoreductase n=1 Tax=Shewanella aestuarii TaxID=1028752 RepID=A0A6G9QHW5_9GAMM|nr:FAD-binding oxidoreductase [Shewanella aestuarii]QIR13469.1 FAD-binding oxidoreductase [Shewanella aestuarii]
MQPYDPLININPQHQPSANSYWASTMPVPQANPALKGCQQTDVAIIGGGYTGLLTAYYLATEFNIDCHVLEANQVGFGASARNAGFVLKGSGRLGYSAMAKRWNIDVAKGIYAEFTEAVARVDGLIKQHQIDCDVQETGYLKVAHNPKALAQLQNAAAFIQQHFGDGAEFIDRETFCEQYMNHHQAYGALRLTDGFGINPLKLLLGYKDMVQQAKVSISEQSCVLEWHQQQGKHRLITDSGELLANQVIMAGNAYTPKRFNAATDNKYLPILSNVIVTEPLTLDELQQAGIHTSQVTMDTRILKYYYRLLPDNRLLFGGRGAVWGKDAANPIYGQRLKMALDKCFPALQHKAIAYNWTGWIAASFDDMPHVYSQYGVGYSLGYCGAGVSFSSQAAYRLAQSMAGVSRPNLPLYQQPLPAQPLSILPFGQLKRIGQWGYYHYGWLKDKFS